MSDYVVESNLQDWANAHTGGTATAEPSYVVPPTPAAKEILDDPHWAAKMQRALAQSDNGEGRSLKEHRENLK